MSIVAFHCREISYFYCVIERHELYREGRNFHAGVEVLPIGAVEMYEVIRWPSHPPIMKDHASIRFKELDWDLNGSASDGCRPSDLWRSECSQVSFIGNHLKKIVSYF